jgi:hypothetical protein
MLHAFPAGTTCSRRIVLFILALMLLQACSGNPTTTSAREKSKVVCDSYIVLNMCVEDLVGDGTVDMIYFSDTDEIFMYQQGRQEQVASVMPFHRCAVPLDARMQETTNRILNRSNLSLTQELDITRNLIASFAAAKPAIDACNERFEQPSPAEMEDEEDFFSGDAAWGENEAS